MLGYGFDEDEFDAAVQYLASFDVPTAIILDSGSTIAALRSLLQESRQVHGHLTRKTSLNCSRR